MLQNQVLETQLTCKNIEKLVWTYSLPMDKNLQVEETSCDDPNND